jgi:hypothetical protein
MVSTELEVVRNFTWAVLGMEDENFDIWEVSLDELPIFNTYMNFSRHHFYCFTIVSMFVLDKLMGLE